MPYLDEAQVELVTVDYFRELGYDYRHGPDIAPDLPPGQAGGEAPERADYAQVVLTGRLRDALARLNPAVPDAALDDALKQVTRPESPSLVVNNHSFHRMLTDGGDVTWRADGPRPVAARPVDW
jgi:type I restriction enzyme R subunit